MTRIQAHVYQNMSIAGHNTYKRLPGLQSPNMRAVSMNALTGRQKKWPIDQKALHF